MTPEGKVKARFARLAKKHGIKYTNLIQTGEIGDPDKIIWVPGGRPILTEFKAEGQKLRPSQAKKFKEYKLLGYDCRVIAGANDVDALIAEITEEATIGVTPDDTTKQRVDKRAFGILVDDSESPESQALALAYLIERGLLIYEGNGVFKIMDAIYDVEITGDMIA